jgi:hypothetical protein
MEEGDLTTIFSLFDFNLSLSPTPPLRQDIILTSDTEQNHLIWCSIKGWSSEVWCLEMRDPQDIDKCYHCLRGARGRGKNVVRARVAGLN